MIAPNQARALREAAGLSLVKLAARADVGIDTIRALEGGQNLMLESIQRIAEALGVSVGELFEEVPT